MGTTMDPQRALLVRVAFDHGAMSRAAVAEWVTARVLEAETVEGPLLDLSSLAGLSNEDVSALLRALSPGASVVEEARMTAAVLGRLVERGRLDIDDAIHSLASWCRGGEGLDERLQEIDWIEEGLYLAREQIFGTREEVEQAFRDLAASYRHLVSTLG